MTDSIVIRLRPGIARADAVNSGTIALDVPFGPPPSFRDVFIESYESIRSSRDALSGPGVTVAVVGAHGFEGSAAVPATPHAINVLSIGRHGRTQLYLPGSPLMSLRQGALIVYPQKRRDEDVRYRVLDLRALVPFEDEEGRAFSALEADGAVFVSTATSCFFIFPRARDEPSWSGSPEEVWEALPERAYLEERELELEQVQDRFSLRAERRASTEGTLALSLPGILVPDEDRLMDEGEAARARLVVRSSEGELTLLLGESAITRGVLLGRYPRCDGSRFGLLSHPTISRVHALVIQIAGKLYAVDVGSTNGVWRGDTCALVAELGLGMPVTLGESVTVECSFLN